MEAAPADIVLLDLNLPGMTGMDFFRKLRDRWPITQVIILTGFGDLESAREAIRLDVVDFLTKPCHLGELEQALDRAASASRAMLPPATSPGPLTSRPSRHPGSMKSSASTSWKPWSGIRATAPPPRPNWASP